MYRAGFSSVFLMLMSIGCGTASEPIAGGKSVDHWLEMVQDKSPAERVEAVKKLGNIGSKSPDAISAIIEALSDTSPIVRKEAIYAVVRNWPAPREALSTLEEMKENDADSQIRKIAEEAYENLSKK